MLTIESIPWPEHMKDLEDKQKEHIAREALRILHDYPQKTTLGPGWTGYYTQWELQMGRELAFHLKKTGWEVPTANFIRVAVEGNDETGDGSPEKPYRTLGHAFEQMGIGDVALIDPGKFEEVE